MEAIIKKLCASRLKNQDFSPRKKAAICTANLGGGSQRRLAELVGTSKSVITRIITGYQNNGTLPNRPGVVAIDSKKCREGAY